MAAVEMVNAVMRVTGRQSPVSVADRESACQRVKQIALREAKA